MSLAICIALDVVMEAYVKLCGVYSIEREKRTSDSGAGKARQELKEEK